MRVPCLGSKRAAGGKAWHLEGRRLINPLAVWCIPAYACFIRSCGELREIEGVVLYVAHPIVMVILSACSRRAAEAAAGGTTCPFVVHVSAALYAFLFVAVSRGGRKIERAPCLQRSVSVPYVLACRS